MKNIEVEQLITRINNLPVIDDFTMKVRDALIYLLDEVQELAADVHY
jgi:cell fate (sporulation/competence/biofilm development) regulator YmcA (YheA/YmcA/DUF963 family)